MPREITGGWNEYVNPILVLKPLPCDGETGDEDDCPFNGRYLCYNAPTVETLIDKPDAHPSLFAYCRDHLPEKYENAAPAPGDGPTVVDTRGVTCDASKRIDDPDRVSPMELQGSFSEVNITQKAGKSAFYDCDHTALLRMFDGGGGHKDFCGKHARASWLDAVEDVEEDEQAETAEASG